MNTSRPNISRVNSIRLNTAILNTTGMAASSGKETIPPAIRESMVCWYDISRQGCTNESMAQNPVLKDLSGNGHDMKCFNFAWGGMSGIGGYIKFPTTHNSVAVVFEHDENSVTFLEILNPDINQVYNWSTSLEAIPSSRIIVTGIPDGARLEFMYWDGESNISLYFTNDGEYILPESKAYHSDKYNITFGLSIRDYTGKCNVRVEFLPLYPGALVSDGVDDYCFAEGLPIFLPDKGFTIVAKREWMSDKECALFSTRTNGANATIGFELYKPNSLRCMSFGATNILNPPPENGISWMTSKNYMGMALSAGDYNEDTSACLFRGFVDNNNFYGQIALYSLILFDRDLTLEEIEWVGKNLIDKDYVLPPPINKN